MELTENEIVKEADPCPEPHDWTPLPEEVIGMWYVNVYELDRHYGGPEEGGWWYDSGDPVAAIPFRTREEADNEAVELRPSWEDKGERYSMAPQSTDYRVVVEDHFPVAWPEHKPHYE
jgi:hypothetical protein